MMINLHLRKCASSHATTSRPSVAVRLTSSRRRVLVRASMFPSQKSALDSNGHDLDSLISELRSRRSGVAPSVSGRDDSVSGPKVNGTVYLVGTGPGDPGLLTLRSVQLMASADVILYDRLVSDDILALANPGAVMVYVGKATGLHTRTQDEIHELLAVFAREGATVVRLKGGDPYVFGRGGEEVVYLAARGIRVAAVPGITAAAGVAAELGVPLTHRGVATSVRYLTGHSREGGEALLDEAVMTAADPMTTLVIYMGLGTLVRLAEKLTSAGALPSTPALAIERGTTVDRRVVYGTLEDLASRTSAAGLRSPTLLVIGAVVALSPGWGAWEAAGKPLEWSDAAEYPPLDVGVVCQGLMGGAGSKVVAPALPVSKELVF